MRKWSDSLLSFRNSVKLKWCGLFAIATINIIIIHEICQPNIQGPLTDTLLKLARLMGIHASNNKSNANKSKSRKMISHSEANVFIKLQAMIILRCNGKRRNEKELKENVLMICYYHHIKWEPIAEIHSWIKKYIYI